MRQSTKVTFEVPLPLKRRMDSYPEVNWSAVLREAIERHARQMEIAREIREEEEDPRVQAVAAMLKRGAAERYRQALRARRH